MALKDIVKVTRKTYFDPRSWIGYDYLKAQTVYLWLFVKLVFGSALPPTNLRELGSFDDAMKEYEVNDKDLDIKQKTYTLFALLFALAGAVMLLMFIKYLLELRIQSSLMSLGIMFLLFSLAFRYDFWRFQIKHRILKCTFNDWWSGKPDKGGKDA